MITTVVCCICVVGTAVIATYGMTSAAPDGMTQAAAAAAAADVCTPFNLLFTSSCILVSSAYYVIIKVSILAMQSLMFGGSRHPFEPLSLQEDAAATMPYSHEDAQVSMMQRKGANHGKNNKHPRRKRSSKQARSKDNAPVLPSHSSSAARDTAQAKDEGGGISPWSFSDAEEGSSNQAASPASVDEIQAAEASNQGDADAAAAASEEKAAKKSSSDRSDSEDSCLSIDLSPSSSSASAAEESGCEEDGMRSSAIRVARGGMQERFTFLKVWTNVYGLAVGIFCIVYSLLLPTEMSSFVFCSCLWAAGLYECVAQYRRRRYHHHHHASLDHGNGRRGGSKSTRRRAGGEPSSISGLLQRCCCSCWYAASRKKKRLVSQLKQFSRMSRSSRSSSSYRKGERDGKASSSSSSSSSMMLLCLCLLMAIGIGFKGAGGLISGRLWPEQTAATMVSFLVPLVGVAAIKNMQNTRNVHDTIELSVPACSMGSLVCLLCIVLAAGRTGDKGWGGCLQAYFWETVSHEMR